MKRTRLNKIGRTGRANIEARKRIAEIAEEKGLNHCELRFSGCTGSWPLAPAHKNKRNYYQGDVEKLSDFKQWVVACTSCHDRIENNKELTKIVFEKLR